MRDLFISPKNSARPKYQSLAESVRAAIQHGRLRLGEALPSSRDLARNLKMHRHTVMNALGELVAEGWIVAVEKRGYFVTRTLPDTFLRPARPGVKVVDAKRPDYKFARGLSVDGYAESSGHRYAFPSGAPDLRVFPLREFKSYLRDALKSKSILGYGDPSGHDKLRREIGTYLRRVRNVDRRDILVTNGSQEAIFLLAQIFIRPGDAVGIEHLGYPPAREALKFAGAKLIPIKVDREGLDVSDLEKKLKRHRLKLLYTTPLYQYPTTVTLSATRRLQLYELAITHNFLILEDDYDHEFHYASQPVAPLASFDPAGRVLYVSTFSKVLFPASRVGFMAVPAEVGRHIAKLKRISSRQNEQLLQASIANWMADGGFERHLRKMRRLYEERRNEIIADLNGYRKTHPDIDWVEPDGGMALWLNLCQDSRRFAEKAMAKSILINPEANFRMDNAVGTHLRLGFSGYRPEENRAALAEMFKLL